MQLSYIQFVPLLEIHQLKYVTVVPQITIAYIIYVPYVSNPNSETFILCINIISNTVIALVLVKRITTTVGLGKC